MAAYAMVELTINDMEKMGPYMEQVGATVDAHGGKYLIRGQAAEILEGNAGEHPLKVILEFPDLAAAKGWYDSAEYQAIIKARTDNSVANFLLIDGA